MTKKRVRASRPAGDFGERATERAWEEVEEVAGYAPTITHEVLTLNYKLEWLFR